MPRVGLLLALLLACLHTQAQSTASDTLPPNRYTTHSTIFGIGYTNQLESYLSPMEYEGFQINCLRETMRRTRWAGGKISVQSLLGGYGGKASNPANTADYLAAAINYQVNWHYNWTPFPALRIMSGLGIAGDLGVVYNTRNGNNPAQARVGVETALSLAAIYRFRIRKSHPAVRYQADIPLMGARFSPNYGQSYYEIFSEGNYDHNVCFTHPGNAFSSRQMLTIDFPIGGFTFRAGYVCDIRQSKLNHLKSHAYNHSFVLGYVKHFAFIKHRDKAAKQHLW